MAAKATRAAREGKFLDFVAAFPAKRGTDEQRGQKKG
jgi:hypothetical protein